MTPESLVHCPDCDSADVESVPLAYQTIKSKNAGRKFLLQDPSLRPLHDRERNRLLPLLSPPREPRQQLPAGALALMAFLVSWLMIGALLIRHIGERNYFLISAVLLAGIVGAFYFMLDSVIEQFKKNLAGYQEKRAEWEQGYFCRDCQKIFTP